MRARVRRGGHDIPESDIRRRYQHSRLNLIELLPALTSLRVYDNSAEADPAVGVAPTPVLVLELQRGAIVNSADLTRAPGLGEADRRRGAEARQTAGFDVARILGFPMTARSRIVSSSL